MKLFKLLQQRCTWIQPNGFDTGIKIYNCVAKEKVPLIVKNKHLVKWYTCGPTVYDSAHVGHASCYVKLDIVQRILKKHCNVRLLTVMNVTDIDDKIIKKAQETNTPIGELTERYETEFWNDLNALNIPKPKVIARVTDHVPAVVLFIKTLLEKNYAYVSHEGSVYFDVEKYSSYNKLESGGDVDGASSSDKRSGKDFALWKATKNNEMSWTSEWGAGRPGWHIECSTLASAVFGSAIDFHAGGVDLRFPHHENEEAQSCCYHGTKQWVNYWIHAGHLHDPNKVKMSKSLRNTISVTDLLKETSSDAFRMACLMSSYRQPMTYSKELFDTAGATLKTIKSFLSTCGLHRNGLLPKRYVPDDVLTSELDRCVAKCNVAIEDDFDTAEVMKTILKLIGFVNKLFVTSSSGRSVSCEPMLNGGLAAVQSYVEDLLDMFGVNIRADNASRDDDSSDDILDLLTTFRRNVRIDALGNKNVELLKLCDALRNDLKDRAVFVNDHGKLSTWNR